MLSDKGYAIQGGVKNFLGETEEVTAPKFWQSSENSPPTELSYITDAEKNLLLQANLHGSLVNNQPNIGASGILSFDGWGDASDGFGGGSSGPAGGASSGGNYGGDSSGGVSTNEMSGVSSGGNNNSFDYETAAYGAPDTISSLTSTNNNNDFPDPQLPPGVISQNFDYETETVLPYTSKLNYIERTDKDSSLEQFGDFYFHERTNSFLLYKTTLLSNLSSSVYETFYPTVYKYEIDSLKFREIYPQKSKNLVGELSAFSFTSLAPNNLITYIQDLSSANDVDIVYEVIDIDRPNLSYDPNTNNYGLTIKARDNTDALAIYYQTYKFIDGQFNNSINEIYFQQGVIRDESYTTPLTAGFLHYSKLDVAPAIASWTGKEGVLKLGE